jgi:hypothetical protein
LFKIENVGWGKDRDRDIIYSIYDTYIYIYIYIYIYVHTFNLYTCFVQCMLFIISLILQIRKVCSYGLFSPDLHRMLEIIHQRSLVIQLSPGSQIPSVACSLCRTRKAFLVMLCRIANSLTPRSINKIKWLLLDIGGDLP